MNFDSTIYSIEILNHLYFIPTVKKQTVRYDQKTA